ncbi:eye-specific diacylglycerol kinase-like [Anopheles darlingi]|uniref:eye-specific diacylglycerol kinase-like n=1 Tax=Anopheles darlingi TaxID=43151 RepID=UPI002100588A|nr:eye-specific diacylglycerol kinase-like [Anopheles darlingi]
MYRLRNTFTRSRTPTGEELKTQSSLEVPKQVRSASFDEIQLEAQRASQLLKVQQQQQQHQQSMDEPTRVLLHVPQTTIPGQRSRSFDLTGSSGDSTTGEGGAPPSVAFLDVPRRFQRRKSNTKTPAPPACVHCLYLEEQQQRQQQQQQQQAQQRLLGEAGRPEAPGHTSSSSDGDDRDGASGGEVPVDGATEDRERAARMRSDAAAAEKMQQQQQQHEAEAGGYYGVEDYGGVNRDEDNENANEGGEEENDEENDEEEEDEVNAAEEEEEYEYEYEEAEEDREAEEEAEEEVEEGEESERQRQRQRQRQPVPRPDEPDEDDEEDEEYDEEEAAEQQQQRVVVVSRRSTSLTPLGDFSTLFQRMSTRGVQQQQQQQKQKQTTTGAIAPPCAITLTLPPPPVVQPTSTTTSELVLEAGGAPSPGMATHLSEIVLTIPAAHPDDQQQSGSGGGDGGGGGAGGEPSVTSPTADEPHGNRTRRRSISRQEAIVIEATDGSVENVAVAAEAAASAAVSPPPLQDTRIPPLPPSSLPSGSQHHTEHLPAGYAPAHPVAPPPPSSPPPPPPPTIATTMILPLTIGPGMVGPGEPDDTTVHDIYLQVPDLKRDRAASVDSCFTKVKSAKTEELLPPDGDLTLLTVVTGSGAIRSRSVDIVLPTEEQARYKALALTDSGGGGAGDGGGCGGLAAADGVFEQLVTAAGAKGYGGPGAGTGGEERRYQIRCTPDWTSAAVPGDHLWVPTAVSGDWCYVGDNDCSRSGPRLKCAGCKIIAHCSCLALLVERNARCKPTFRLARLASAGQSKQQQQQQQRQRQQQQQHQQQPLLLQTAHHWVHRRTGKGKCGQCGKSLQAKLSFSSKEIVALSCAWCKSSYHNKEACFSVDRISEECLLGTHRRIVVPPSWIVKLTRRGSSKVTASSTSKERRAAKGAAKQTSVKKASSGGQKRAPPHPAFIVRPVPRAKLTPVLVFINPKSGGNQGSKLIQKFQWLLNPRQVFDLSQGGPRMGLELFRKVPHLRVLACGGDGTVGWVLSVLDQINFRPAPAVGVLPLGTGNDLARALGWGGGYTDEPIGKVLANIEASEPVRLDRWMLKVEPNVTKLHTTTTTTTTATSTTTATATTPAGDGGKDNLPLNVVNNYFSLGVDAHIALEFHEAREAHPEKFNSRLRNKMFYGQAGGKDLLKRKWKGLAEFVTLECDGKDLTPKLKEHKVHAIVFLNIPSYGGGTHPWNKSGGQFEPAIDDGLIEVVGLTTYQLPLLQAGGHGTCIAQCRSAKIVTSKIIPMQVDGEACKLRPSVVELTLLNQAVMLAKKKSGKAANLSQEKLETLNVQLLRIGMADYEQLHYDKEQLRQSAVSLGTLETRSTDLEQVRLLINRYCGERSDCPKLSPDWCFIDSCTAERFFRVDRAQENLHCITDIATDCRLFLLDQDGSRPPAQPQPQPQPPPTAVSLCNAGSTDTEPTPGSSSGSGGSSASPYYKYPTLNRSLSGPPGSESFSFPTVKLLARKNSQEAVCCAHQSESAGSTPRPPSSVQLQPPR